MKLQFTKAKGKPKKGMFVALHNCFPVEAKGSLGLIVEVKKGDDSFRYGVLEFYDKKIYHHHISTIIPLNVRWDFKV
jgi:hypothetical protein